MLGLGHDKDQQPRRPSRVKGLAEVEQIAAGWKHSAAVTSGGRLFTWGWGGSQGAGLRLAGVTGAQGPSQARGQPWQLAFMFMLSSGHAPRSLTVTMPAGTALSFESGTGTGGQLGHGNDFDYWQPQHVEWLQLGETDWAKQHQEDGGQAWKVQQVSGMGGAAALYTNARGSGSVHHCSAAGCLNTGCLGRLPCCSTVYMEACLRNNVACPTSFRFRAGSTTLRPLWSWGPK